MSNSSLSLQRVLPVLSSIMGLLALGGGITSIVRPQTFAENIGFPITGSSSAVLPLAQFMGARNLGTGITVLTLLYTGRRKAVGLGFMCGVSTAMLDAWICYQQNGTEGKALGHAFMGVLAGLLGAGMYWG